MDQLFNYQLVFRCKHATLNDTTIVVTGETHLHLNELLDCVNDTINLNLDLVSIADLYNVVYQPKINSNEQKEA